MGRNHYLRAVLQRPANQPRQHLEHAWVRISLGLVESSDPTFGLYQLRRNQQRATEAIPGIGKGVGAPWRLLEDERLIAIANGNALD
jgi:hypothetical protein